MSDDDTELAAFIREHLRSVWALELLLVLRRDPDRCWTPVDLVAEMRASTPLINDNLRGLERSGLATCDDAGCWRYVAVGPVLDGLVVRIEQAYRQRPVAIINLISKPIDPIQGLADAFKWRGDK